MTGATGFVGSHLVRRLVRDGVEVHVLCRPASDFWRLRDVVPRLRMHQADLSDLAGLEAVVRSVRPTFVFHVAAATVVAGVAAGPAELIGVNLLGAVNLVQACDSVDYRSLVMTGDSFEYSPSRSPLGESAPCRPTSLHGITKLAATLHGQAAARSRGRPIVTLRLFSTYGPYDNPRRLVPRVIAGALAGSTIELSRPEIARDWIHVDDLVELYLEASRAGGSVAGQVFNAGSGRAASLGDIVAAILHATGSAAEIRWGAFPAAEHDAYPWIADMRSTFASFAWRPLIPLEEGLRRTIDQASEARRT